MLLHPTTVPPFSSAARSTVPAVRNRGSGTPVPCTRSRATPPSGYWQSRTWVTRSAGVHRVGVAVVPPRR